MYDIHKYNAARTYYHNEWTTVIDLVLYSTKDNIWWDCLLYSPQCEIYMAFVKYSPSSKICIYLPLSSQISKCHSSRGLDMFTCHRKGLGEGFKTDQYI